MFKLPDVKRAVSFPHFYISDVNKIQVKIPVMLKIHFSESSELFGSPTVKWRPFIIIMTIILQIYTKRLFHLLKHSKSIPLWDLI